jgi:hypothetical protein
MGRLHGLWGAHADQIFSCPAVAEKRSEVEYITTLGSRIRKFWVTEMADKFSFLSSGEF